MLDCLIVDTLGCGVEKQWLEFGVSRVCLGLFGWIWLAIQNATCVFGHLNWGLGMALVDYHSGLFFGTYRS